MPSFVDQRNRIESVPARAAAEEVFAPELVPRNCRLGAYKKVRVPAVKVSGQIIAYASPDSTFAVTKWLFDAARKSILIGIYDFTAEHVKQLVLHAMRRNVKVQLMLDLDGKAEAALLRELERFGADCTQAPSCSSKRAQYFRSSHEKVIVIDDEWTLVQSGNYSDNSIPLNVVDSGREESFVTGNRDMGLAVQSKPLAAFFRRILEADISLELAGAEAAAAFAAVEDAFVVERAPARRPKTLYPSKTVTLPGLLAIRPILSPDNYMTEVPPLLRAAKRSILIEQQYIRASQSHIEMLLTEIAAARKANPRLDVRIVLGKVFNAKDLPKEHANLDVLKQKFGLALGKHIRFVDTTRFVHCHNKMILIDGKGVLISSQNWSNAAVSENREAGLWLEHRGIRDYFARIFEDDWSTAAKTPGGDGPEVISAETLREGGFVRVMAGDYAEV